MRVLSVDAGRTHCRVAVVDGDQVTAGPAVVDSGVTLADPDGAVGLAGRIRAAVAALPRGGEQQLPSVLVVAAAGGLTRPAQSAQLAAQLTDLVAERVIVTSDVVAAHAGAFAGEAGVVLAVGTGAVALGVAPDGRHLLVDGGGWLVGDDGSGFAVGRAGLAAALRHTDGRPGGSAALAQAAVDRFAPTPPPENPTAAVRAVLAALHADPDPARVASFAPEVAAAARAGDPVAAGIWQQAVEQLTETVRAAGAVSPGPRFAVTVTGALSSLEDLLVAPLRARLAHHNGTVVAAGVPDALVGAARLALSRTGAYQSLLCAHAAGLAAGDGRYPAGRRSAAVRAPAGSGSHARREHG